MRKLTLLGVASIGLIAVHAVPLVTLHALAGHQPQAGHHTANPGLMAPGAALLLAMTLAAALPACGAILGLAAWVRARCRLATIQSHAEECAVRGIAYWRFPGEDVTFFVAGAWRPRIYVSTGAESRLGPEPFRAALLHEQAHCQNSDVLLRQVLSVAERAFGLLPPVRSGIAALLLRSECAADRQAIAAGAPRLALFDAIVAAAHARATPAAAHLSDGALAARLEALASPAAAVPSPGFRAPAAIGAWLVLPPVAAHALISLLPLCAVWP